MRNIQRQPLNEKDHNMLVFLVVAVALTVITGLGTIFAEKDSQQVHIAEYEKLIHVKETVLNASPEEIEQMKEQLVKIKSQYNLK